jgi:hypothetical protein
MKNLIALMMGFLILTSCSNSQEIEVSVSKLLHYPQKLDDSNLYRKFLIYGKDAIPILISKIDVNRKSYSGFFNPLNSNLMSLVNYDGVYAAYMIEFILSRDKLNETEINDPMSYIIYNRDVIIRPKDMRPLEYKDMLAIKNIYVAWWQQNKERPIGELRTEWKRKKRPLSNSIYRWY